MYKYVSNNLFPFISEPDQNTINKAIAFFGELWGFLEKYNAIIPGDSEQEVSSVLINNICFNWLDDKSIIFVVSMGYEKGRLIKE